MPKKLGTGQNKRRLPWVLNLRAKRSCLHEQDAGRRTQDAPLAAKPHEPDIHHLETYHDASEDLTSTPASRHAPLEAEDVRPFSNTSSRNNCLLRHVSYPIGPSRAKRSGRGGLRLMSAVECTCCEKFSRGPRQPASTTSLKPLVQCARASSRLRCARRRPTGRLGRSGAQSILGTRRSRARVVSSLDR
jgi:hypothetical protein